LERLLVAINISNSHWAFMVAHMRDKKIVYHDSMVPDQETSTEHMTSFHRLIFIPCSRYSLNLFAIHQ
jgi:Ulp1 family protease